MAVVITGKRLHESYSQKQERIVLQYTISGTYTSAFVTPFLGVTGSPGTNQVASKNPLLVTWYSPTGYLYASTVTITNGNPVVTTRIFSAPGVELAAGAAMPDASVLCAVDALRY
jgi:hypothetical protein